MASSSSPPLWEFDVFLSFTGEDTRKTFVSYLYKELVRMGIRTFRDDDELREGKSISPELLQAIRESKFAVVVISQNYASSGWCLDELLEIVECEENGSLTILPVFYEVDPLDVKKQSGPFAESFRRHEDNPKVNPEKIQRWKEALTKVATIAGEDSRNWGEDSDLIEKIVNEISNQLVSVMSSDFSPLVGMDFHMKELSTLMDLESTNEVRMVGIWGMPGVGKTTLARYVYEKISQRFQAHCFVEDVKKFYRENGPARLQEVFFSKNLQEAVNIRTLQVGSNVIKARLGHPKILVVIDDVDAIEQLHVLARETNWFCPGSRIIMTTQNKHLLDAHGVDHVYEVKCLTWETALQLFCFHAFKHKQSMKGFEQLSIQAVSYANGLPLALKVLGSFLCGRSKEEWENTFCKLEGSFEREITDILKVSYDGLDEQEKEIFLHVACLFDGERVEDVSRVLGGNQKKAEMRIRTLAEKSLIVISSFGCINMHGLLQQMGRELARGRLLTDPEEIGDALMDNEVNREIQGISLDTSLIREDKLPNLRCLKISKWGFNDEAEVHRPSGISFGDCKLKCLHWDVYPLRTLHWPFDSLDVLDMRQSKLEKLWEGSLPLRSLKRIDLRASQNLRGIPDLSGASNLMNLDVGYCRSLVEVPSSISGLTQLSHLTLQGCSMLGRLPSIPNLNSLQDLRLSGCKRLKSFPQISQNIRRLQVTFMSDIELPDSIGKLSHLVELKISCCKRLKTLPITVGNLRSLERVEIEGCEMLESIPDTVEELLSLAEFVVIKARNIRKIPHLPPNLSEIIFTSTSIEEVPSWIGDLSELQIMGLEDNRRLKNLPASISKLECLESLCLGGCSSLESLPAKLFETMSLLEDLDLSRTSIKGLSDNLGNRMGLRGLHVSHDIYKPDGEPFSCPLLPGLPLLLALKLRNLNMVEIPDDLGHCLPHLMCLDLSGNDFQTVPTTIKHLSSLERLYLCNCKNLRSLPEVSSSVSEIYAHGCVSLETASQALYCSVQILVLSGCIRLNPKEARSVAQHLASRVGGRERWLRAWLPSSRVPRCFKHQAEGPSLTIHLPNSHHVNDISGFATCVVVAAERHYDISGLEIGCYYDFRDKYGQCVCQDELPHHPCLPLHDRVDVESEHMYLCRAFIFRPLHKEEFFQDILLSFHLDHLVKSTLRHVKVKACGVRLLFQGDIDDECDDNDSTDETSDEETEISDKRQESSMSSSLS